LLTLKQATLILGLFAKMRLRIIVADDNERTLLALVAVLSIEFEVIATAKDGQSALDHVRRLRPSVVVLDLNMPELNGIEVTRAIVREDLSAEVVICSVSRDPELIAAARMAGALGYVFKTSLNRDLPCAVKRAASGEPFISGA
jgi:two-component system, NarL family, nitrate/nitrite response regulator NarL